MQSRMSTEQFRYFYHRLHLFWPDRRIASELAVSQLTLSRWVKVETTPSLSMYSRFEVVLEGLINGLRKDAKGTRKFYHDIADALMLDTPPRHSAPIEGGRDTAKLRDLILDKCEGRWARLKPLLHEARDMGYSRMQVEYMGKKLKVEKKVIGNGRAAITRWKV